jgi:hypothetical protein
LAHRIDLWLESGMALLHKARRTAILRQRRLDLAQKHAQDYQTPLPMTVVTGPAREPDSAPAASVAGSSLRRPRWGRRLALFLTALPVLAALPLTVAGVAARARLAPGAPPVPASLALHALAAERLPVPIPAPLPLPAPAPVPVPPGEAPLPVPIPAPSEPHPRADAHLNRVGHGHIGGGVLFVPTTFSSEDGTYDLYLHFHGNTRVVLESAEHVGLNAIVAVVNVGVNSAPYLDAYEAPGSYEKTLGEVGRALAERGLENGHLRRVAVGSWSGGYGAVSRILEHDTGTASLDAVLVMEGIHCGFLEESPKELNVRIISPFLRGAKRAAEGKMLFSITHSEIDPIAYAGTDQTAGYLLDAVHGRRGEPAPAPEHVQLRAAEGAVSKRLEKWMEPTSEATVGSFHVRGYRGNTPEHHMAHLLQMAATVMPELAERWAPP